MKENKTNRIAEFSDSDFLSFLYSEREREDSLNKYQGWNIWALAGASITVVCAGYSILKEDGYLICSQQVVYLVSCMLALGLLVYPYILILSFFLKPRRGVDDKKIRTLKDIVPYYYLGLSTIAAGTFIAVIPFVDTENPWNVVPCTWGILLVSYLLTWVSAYINKDKVVNPRLSDMAFVGIGMHSSMIGLWCGLLNVVVVFSFKQIEMPLIGSANFEFAVSVVSLILLGFLLLFVYMKERRSNILDVAIDEYLYKGATQEDVFRTLRVRRMGHTALESCGMELLALRKTLDAYEQNKSVVEDIDKEISNASPDIHMLNGYVDKIRGVMAYFDEFEKAFSRMYKKLEQIGNQIPMLKYDEEYANLITIASTTVKKEKVLSGYTREVSDKLMKYSRPYLCQKYGGLCMRECELRHDRPSLLVRLAQNYRFQSQKVKLSCKRLYAKSE